MVKNIKSICVLVSICAVMALLLAATNAITAPIIADNAANAANASLKKVMPNGVGFEEMDISGIDLPATVVKAHKETTGQGYVVELSTTGYASGLNLMCGVSTDGIITGATCLGSNETWGLEEKLGDQMVGKDATSVVDVEAGATSKTINGYRSAMVDALKAATILGGGTADLRSPEEILNDNLKAALPAADEFVKQVITDEALNIDFIYAAKNGTGYVYVIEDKTFIGLDATGTVISEGADADAAALAQSKAALAAKHTKVDTTDSGINEHITAVQKNAEGNYVIEINGLGFAYFGDDHAYQDPRNIPIQICVVMTPKGTILKCVTLAHEESANYGAACGEEAYYSQYDGKTADTYKDVDAIAKATITTKGYQKAIERCFEAVKILEGGAK